MTFQLSDLPRSGVRHVEIFLLTCKVHFCIWSNHHEEIISMFIGPTWISEEAHSLLWIWFILQIIQNFNSYKRGLEQNKAH